MIFPMYADACPEVTIWWCDVCDRTAVHKPGPRPAHTCPDREATKP